MIIDKLDSNEYLCRVGDKVFKIPSKEMYLEQKKDIEDVKEPTDKELIEIGKQNHEFYRKEHVIETINRDIAEIEQFEATLEPVIIKK